MNEQQALQVIKQSLDIAAARGVFENLQAAAVTFKALQVVTQKIQQPSKTVAKDGSTTEQQQQQ